jgi:integrase
MKVKGNGSIRQVKNKKGEVVKNSWQLIISLGYDPLDKQKRVQKCRSFRGNKTQAHKALADFRREIEHGLKVDADKITFKEYAEQWQKAREESGSLASSSIVRDKCIVGHLLRHLATVQLRDIEASMVRSLYIALARDGLGQNTIAKAAVTLKQILKQAVNDDIILRNPCERVDAPRPPKQKNGTALDKAGVARLAEALRDAESNDYPLAQVGQQRLTTDMAHVSAIRLALSAGLRRGEILGLSWGDVDFNNKVLHVQNNLCAITGELKSPKTENSNRTVFLDPQMLLDLKRWQHQQAQYLLSIGIKQDDTTPVICANTGGRMDGDNLSRWWRAFQKRYGFEGLRLHDLRHTHATMLVSSGLNIKAVSSRLGHASVGITLDLYAHAQREDDERAAAIIGEIMAQPVPQMGQVINL